MFLVTRQRLVTADRDDLVDLYDARVGPPLPVAAGRPTAPPCDGRGVSAAAVGALLPDESLGSLLARRGRTRRCCGSGPCSFAQQRRVQAARQGRCGSSLSGAGKLGWSGDRPASGSIKRSRAGTYRAAICGSASTRERSSRGRGRYTTVVRLTFIAAGGDQVTKHHASDVQSSGEEGTLRHEAHPHAERALLGASRSPWRSSRRPRPLRLAAPALKVTTLSPDYVTAGKGLLMWRRCPEHGRPSR